MLYALKTELFKMIVAEHNYHVSCYQKLLATATSNQLVRPGFVPANLPSAIRRAQKSNRRSLHSTNPCIDPPWLEHLLFSTLAIDLSIYVKDKNSSTEKVSSDITSPL